MGAETDPYRVALAVEQYLRTNLRLLPAAAVRRLRLALRGVPLRDPHRVLPALRRRHGRAPPLQRHPRPRRRRLHRRRRRAERRVGRDAQRRPLVGRGVLPGRRMGAVRPDAGTADPEHRRRARQRPRRRRGGRARRRRSVTRAVERSAGEAGRARVADPGGPAVRPRRRRRRRPPAGCRGRSGSSRSSSSGRPAARCCAGAAWSAGPRRSGCARPSRCCTPTCVTTASRCRPPGRSTRRRGYLRERLGVDAGDLPARVQAVAFGGRPASEADLAGLADLRRRVRRRLRERVGRPAAVLALYGIRPAHARRRLARPGDRVRAPRRERAQSPSASAVLLRELALDDAAQMGRRRPFLVRRRLRSSSRWLIASLILTSRTIPLRFCSSRARCLRTASS